MDRRTAESNRQLIRHSDIYIYQCGGEQCEEGHSYGPAVRDHYLIHYIHKGKGIFQVDDTTYELKAGDGFLICPGILTYYKADTVDPWQYSWIGFHGIKAESCLREAGLAREHPVFHSQGDDMIENCFQEMTSAYYLKRGSMMKRMAYLYLFLYRLTQSCPQNPYDTSAESKQDLYITETLHFMEANYSRKLTVEMIARHVGLNRSYLSALFREALGKPISEYLMEFRIRKACELLSDDSLSISNVAYSVGYTDPLLFSKIFRRIEGCPPSQFRKELQSIDAGRRNSDRE